MKKPLNTLFLFITFAIMVMLVTASTLMMRRYEIELRQATFVSTHFDLILSSPSADQVTEYDADSRILSIMPLYNFEITVEGSASALVNILLTPQSYFSNVGLLNEDTLIQGKFDSTGLMLDDTAAKKLGVRVGDELSFRLSNQVFTKKVSGVFLPSTYPLLSQGIVFGLWTDEMEAAFTNSLSYNLAFVDVDSLNSAATVFQGYVPMGQLMTEEDYTTQYKSENVKPGYYTDEQWDAAIHATYESYQNDFLLDNHASALKYKHIVEAEILLSNQVTAERLESLRIWILLIVFLTGIFFAVADFIRNRPSYDYDAKRGLDTKIQVSRLIKKHTLLFIASISAALLVIIVFSLGVVLKVFLSMFGDVLFPIVGSILAYFFSFAIVYYYHNQLRDIRKNNDEKDPPLMPKREGKK